MVKIDDLDEWFESRQFHFAKLVLTGMDNKPVLEINRPEMADEEICLFHRDVSSGDAYFERLHERIRQCVAGRQAMPFHRDALQYLSVTGIMTPLIFPGNIGRKAKGFFLFWEKSEPLPLRRLSSLSCLRALSHLTVIITCLFMWSMLG